MTRTTIDITPSPRLLEVLGEIPFATWQCVAELVDNSLDEVLKTPARKPTNPLVVDIKFDNDPANGACLVVSDNGSGMTLEELEHSLRAGHSSKNRYGSLGLFGMGFNIATARLGSVTTVETTTAGSSELLSVTIDFTELQRKATFQVPVIRKPTSPATFGTTVRVRLKRLSIEEFLRDPKSKALRQQLGGVYSFLLRDKVPGINKLGYSVPTLAKVTLNGESIEPVLPCIWSDSRFVTSAGSDVCAVQYVDRVLTSATACLRCGYWDKKNGPEVCEECGSTNLELRERRIWGWIGIQRYIDSSHFGIDFIRYGRRILNLDKSVFTYADPDTLQNEVEYPIEMPANRGRIVGEIHLDHVPVTYQKNEFDRQSRDWQVAIETIRGDGPMKPRSSHKNNASPLARLYSAFRRNDPGLRYLTPGDGKTAIHEKAKEWAKHFDKGVARYLDDTEWYDSVVRHQSLKDGFPGTTQGGHSSGNSILGEGVGGGAITTLLGGVAPTNLPPQPQSPSGATPAMPATMQDILERARLLGQPRADLSGDFTLEQELGSWSLTVITTKQRLHDVGANKGATPARAGKVQGKKLEILVWDEHPVFREFGRDVRDVALMQAAEMIKGYGPSTLAVTTIYGELVRCIPDLRMTEVAILERIARTMDSVRELMLGVVTENPSTYWVLLSASDKATIETAAGVNLSTVPFKDIIDDGRFVSFLPADGIRRLIETRPVDFFEGKVFKPGIATRSEEARARVVAGVLRDIATLNDFQQDHLLRQKHDIAITLISLDHFESQIVSEDFN